MKTLAPDTLLATTLRAIGDGVIFCDREGCVVMMNAAAQEMTGWGEAEAQGRPLQDVFLIMNETTRERTEDPVGKALRLGRVVGLANHTLLLRRDGTEIAIDDSAAPVLDDAGTLRGVVLVFRDVSDRRKAEWNVEMLAESGKVLGHERDVRGIMLHISELVSKHFADFCMFDLLRADGTLDRMMGRHRNPALQELPNGLQGLRPRPAPSNHPITQVLKTREVQLMSTITDDVLERMSSGPEHLAYFREQLRPNSILSVPLIAEGELLGAMTFFRHTTKAVYTEVDVAAGVELGQRIGLAVHYARLREELRTERARLAALFEAVPVGMVVSDPQGRIVMTNREVETIFRHAAIQTKDFAGHAAYPVLHPNLKRLTPAELPLPRAVAEQRTIRNEHYLYERGDGTLGWVSLSAAPVIGDDGSLQGGVVAVSDVDGLVRARERVENSERRMQVMMDRASVGIAIGDMRGGLQYANDVLLQMIGYTREELERGEVRWDRMTPPECRAADAEAMVQLRELGYAHPYEKAYVAKDGRRVPMLVGAAAVPPLEGEGGEQQVAVFYTDLTLQKRAEAALLQTEKLTAVGRLASSISHEINNPLEAVTNLLYIVRGNPGLSQSDRDYLDAADRELARVSQITAQTLRFHRQSTSATTIRPEALLDEVLSIYRSRLGASGVVVEQQYGDNVWVTCFEGDIRQVLSNLIGNAFDAMRQGGRLVLRTRNATWMPTGQPGVMITLADTGSGMSDEVKKRVFEAFYSTKGINGTGLGLWISRRIIHKHRGHLSVRSRVGELHGTVFQLWLPRELAASASEAWHEVEISGKH